MANALPDAMQLREIKYGQRTTEQQRLRVAQQLRDAGRLAEALDLYLIVGDDEGIAAMQQQAAKEGRPVLLVMMERAGREIPASTWSAAGKAALADKRWREAFRAFNEAGDEEGLAQVREHLPEYDFYVPQGK
jgi:hypothetical protein